MSDLDERASARPDAREPGSHSDEYDALKALAAARTSEQPKIVSMIEKAIGPQPIEPGRCAECGRWRKIIAVNMCRDCLDEIDGGHDAD